MAQQLITIIYSKKEEGLQQVLDSLLSFGPRSCTKMTENEKDLAIGLNWPGSIGSSDASRDFFIFLFFISVFYKNIFLIWKFIEIYPGRPAAGDFVKKISRRKLRRGPWGSVTRQRGGRPWPPGCRATGSPTLI